MTVTDLPAAVIAAPIEMHATLGDGGDPLLIHKRDRITLSVRVGVARVERQVTALQNARDGQMLFVKTDDGEVLSARAGREP